MKENTVAKNSNETDFPENTGKSAAGKETIGKDAVKEDPLPPAVRQVIELFSTGPLAGVEFPGVDLHAFELGEDMVRRCVADVEALQKELTEARRHLDEMQRSLKEVAELGINYARVFASQDEALLDVVNDIDLGKKPKKKRRRRKKKKVEEPVDDKQLSLTGVDKAAVDDSGSDAAEDAPDTDQGAERKAA